VKQFLYAIDTTNEWVGRFFSFWVIGIIAVTFIEVISRFVFNRPFDWAHEITLQLYAIYVLLGGGYALIKKAHVKVDIVLNCFSPRRQAIIELVSSVYSFLFMGALIHAAWLLTLYSVMVREINISLLWLPIYPIKACLLIGSVLLFLQLLAKFLRDLHIVMKGAKY